MTVNRVFISALNMKAPGISGMEDFFSTLSENKSIVFKKEVYDNETIFLSEKIDLTASPYYPSRSNEKVMRSEVVAATVCAKELIEKELIPVELLSEIPLYISSGVFLEKQEGDLDWLTKAFTIIVESKTVEEKNRKLNQLLPPLLALRTLTNSAESFVAQSTGLAGNNTTFGNTSQSAYAALKEGFRTIQTGASEIAVVGGTNRGGVSSFFLHKTFSSDKNSNWKECTAVSFLILESEKSLKAKNKKAWCEIVKLESSTHVPKIFGSNTTTLEEAFPQNNTDPEMSIIGGAFREEEYLKDKLEAEKKWKEVFSLFPLFGNLGSAGLFMNIAAALFYFNEKNKSGADCIDKDVYNRFSKVTLKRVES
jgi:hypothetical protein